MRRRLMRFLPVFMLALMVQVLAPIGACLASAIAASDPLSAAVLCSETNFNHTPGKQTDHHMRDGSCSLCAAAAPFSPPSPPLAVPETRRETYRVEWHATAPDRRAAKIATSAQARAPPHQS